MEIPLPHTLKKSSGFSRSVKKILRSIVNDTTISFIHKNCARGATSLVYHRILEAGSSGVNLCPGLAMRQEEFEEHIRFCAKHFDCIDLATAVSRLKDGILSERALIVTFDDGYKDNLTEAVPILEKYGVPATIFISSGLIDGTAPIWWYEQEQIIKEIDSLSFPIGRQTVTRAAKTVDEKGLLFFELAGLSKLMNPEQIRSFMEILREQYLKVFPQSSLISLKPTMLSWDEIRHLDKHPLITIGAHTDSHPVLSILSDKEVENDIHISRSRLEKELGHDVLFFAYPYGQEEQAGAREAHIVSSMGFSCALTTRVGFIHPGFKDSLFLLPRIAPESEINPLHSLAHIRWKLSGLSPRFFRAGR